MEMERSKPLHNFTMPCLKWGAQKLLRCMKVDSNGDASAVDRKSSAAETRRYELEKRRSSDRLKSAGQKIVAGEDNNNEIEVTREKLMFDFHAEVGKIKDAIMREKLDNDAPQTAEAEAARPWNLRTRRSPVKNLNVDVSRPNLPNFSPLRNESKSPAMTVGEKREREKFSVSLSRSEIEDDFTAMSGRRLPRKPKKRPRIVQRQLDTLFPGLWLSEVNADLYRVPDEVEAAAV